MFGMPVEGEGAGSGAVIDKRGHIVTNQHVIDGARKIEVALTNGKMYDAELVGEDAEYDIAVLRIDAPAADLNPIRLGRSDNLRVGQKAYALGNPFGLDHTLTSGVVSSLNRSLPSRVSGRIMDGMVQTDAAMNPGNSGGPLLNTSAEMIGMCVAIRSSVGQNSGVGFAIPIDRVRRFVPELIEKRPDRSRLSRHRDGRRDQRRSPHREAKQGGPPPSVPDCERFAPSSGVGGKVRWSTSRHSSTRITRTRSSRSMASRHAHTRSSSN